MKRERTDCIVVHCSATEPALTIGAREIRDWHQDKGWKDIGYHFVIRRNGTIELGREIESLGAHVRGHNHNSVGVCLVGGVDENGKSEANYTDNQLLSLRLLINGLKVKYQKAKLIGHCDFPEVAKDCPCFDVREWYGRR